MLDVLSRTLGDQEEVSVQANQLLGQLHPRLSSFFHVLASQNFVNRSMIVPFSLIYLLLYLYNILSTSSQGMVFGDRPEDVRNCDCFQILRISWSTGSALVYPETQTFQCRGTKPEEKQDPLCTTWDQLLVRTISECVACLQ